MGQAVARVCILCAVDDENFAAVSVLKRVGGEITKRFIDGYPYSQGSLPIPENGGKIEVCVFQLADMGNAEVLAGKIVEKMKPIWIFMCGICAGREGEVVEGDVIVAESVFHIDLGGKRYANGDFRSNAQGISLRAEIKAKVNSFHEDLRRIRVVLAPLDARPSLNHEWRRHYVLKALFEAPSRSMTQDELIDRHGEKVFGSDDHFQTVRSHLISGENPLVKIEVDRWILTEKGVELVSQARCDRPMGFATWPLLPSVEPKFLLAPVAVTSHVREDMPAVWKSISSMVRRVAGVEMEGMDCIRELSIPTQVATS